jgi:D-2-hydroxyacid dehydrogenase (NADP+)
MNMSEKSVSVLIHRPLEIWTPLEKGLLQQITAVSPRIKAVEISDLAYAERRENLGSKEQLDTLLAEVEVIFGTLPSKNVIARAPKLKWIHSPLAGVESVLVPEVVKSPMMVTNSRGIHGTQASELAITLMLMFAKQTSLIFGLKQEKRWHTFVPELLQSKTVAVLGLGAIGAEMARLAKAFRMKVVAVRARAGVPSRYADIILPPEQLREALALSDFVVNALPYTRETDKLIGERELRAMKPTAYFINIGRGRTVDEIALIRALEENWIAGAGLDALTTEPLPSSSRFWELPNVIITPHIAGQRKDYDVLANKLFCENLRRYISGKKLLNIVNKRTGH